MVITYNLKEFLICIIYDGFQIGWFANPIYSEEGDYPKVMRERVFINSKNEGRSKSRLPVFTPEEINLIKGDNKFSVFI